MSERVSDKMLRNMLKYLKEDHDTADQKLGFDIAYGGIQLVIVHPNKGMAESDLSRRLTRREMYEVLHTMANMDRAIQSKWLK